MKKITGYSIKLKFTNILIKDIYHTIIKFIFDLS